MEKSPKISKNLCCELCNYYTSKNSEYSKHILTRKHQNRTNENNKSPKISDNLRRFFKPLFPFIVLYIFFYKDFFREFKNGHL